MGEPKLLHSINGRFLYQVSNTHVSGTARDMVNHLVDFAVGERLLLLNFLLAELDAILTVALVYRWARFTIIGWIGFEIAPASITTCFFLPFLALDDARP